jgi:hypothetical protein
MIKMVIESWKRDDLTVDQYTKHLTVNHAEMVREYGHLMGFERYVQNPRIDAPALSQICEDFGWAPAPSGSVGLWFLNEGSLATAMNSEAGREASAILKEDELRFINPAKISAFLSVEEVILEGSAARSTDEVKLVLQVAALSDADRNKTLTAISDLAGRLLDGSGGRCVASRRIESAEIDRYAVERGWRAAPDGVVEFWWPSQGAFDGAMDERGQGQLRKVLVECQPLVAADRTTAFLSREIVAYDNDPLNTPGI